MIPFDNSVFFRLMLIPFGGEKKKSCNLIFLPPLGIRFFDVDVLAPYAVETDQMLVYEVHMLWLTVLEQYKKDPQSMELDVTGRELILQQ